MQIIQLKGKDKYLYRLLAPLVMDPEVIRANNNYPFKTGDNYIWYIALESGKVMGFIPVEQKNEKLAVLNNYYVNAEGQEREEILSQLLPAIITRFNPENCLLHAITLVQDKETFEKYEFVSMDKKWTRYVKMHR